MTVHKERMAQSTEDFRMLQSWRIHRLAKGLPFRQAHELLENWSWNVVKAGYYLQDVRFRTLSGNFIDYWTGYIYSFKSQTAILKERLGGTGFESFAGKFQQTKSNYQLQKASKRDVYWLF